MTKKLTKIILMAGLALIAGSVYASPPLKTEDRALEPVADPKKKKAGEECKTSDECRRHHTCSKVDNKSVCVAPVYTDLPRT